MEDFALGGAAGSVILPHGEKITPGRGLEGVIFPLGGRFRPTFFHWVEDFASDRIAILSLGEVFASGCLGRGSEFFHWVEVFAPWCLGMGLQFFHWVEVLGLGALPTNWDSSTGWKCFPLVPG